MYRCSIGLDAKKELNPMSDKPSKTGTSSVTVERNGARSVNLGHVLNSERAQNQLL